MLIVNPEERVNISDVVKYCTDQLDTIQKRDAKNSMRNTPMRMANNKSELSNTDDGEGEQK